MNFPINIERRDASKASGRDFDLNFWIAAPPKPVEVKAKVDDTVFSAKTLSKTIKDASGQIPQGQIGFLFLRIPPRWVGPELEAIFHDYMADALTSRDESSTRHRISVVFSAVDKVYGSPQEVTVSRHWDLVKAEHCPPHDWEVALQLKQFDESGLTHMAPAAPF